MYPGYNSACVVRIIPVAASTLPYTFFSFRCIQQYEYTYEKNTRDLMSSAFRYECTTAKQRHFVAAAFPR